MGLRTPETLRVTAMKARREGHVREGHVREDHVRDGEGVVVVLEEPTPGPVPRKQRPGAE